MHFAPLKGRLAAGGREPCLPPAQARHTQGLWMPSCSSARLGSTGHKVLGTLDTGSSLPGPAAGQQRDLEAWGNVVLLSTSIPNEAATAVAWQWSCSCLLKEINQFICFAFRLPSPERAHLVLQLLSVHSQPKCFLGGEREKWSLSGHLSSPGERHISETLQGC